MKIHEYQAKEILRNYGVPVPDGHVCYNSASARDWAKRLGDGPWVIKAQIHAGGRGKGGGIKIARTPEEVKQQHLAPNDAMLYHSSLLYCVDEETAGEELFTFAVTWTDPVTRTPQSRSVEITLGELLDSDAVNLEKSNILVAYARLISNADSLDSAAWEEAKLSLSARIEAYQELMSDDDLVEVESVLAHTRY